ncbi:pre-mrna-splicing regulator wtap [Fusarium bulbicola]|nr:pre-mrna-splicing regulator wtap [Fusarium bulbicola]
MIKLILLFSALSMATSQMCTLETEVCPVPVVVQPIVFIRKTPVLLSTEICEETILTLGSTTFPVNFVPTIVEATFEVVTTVTLTPTVSPIGGPISKRPPKKVADTVSQIHGESLRTGESQPQSSFSNTGSRPAQTDTAINTGISSTGGHVASKSDSSKGEKPSATGGPPAGSTGQSGFSAISSSSASSAGTAPRDEVLPQVLQGKENLQGLVALLRTLQLKVTQGLVHLPTALQAKGSPQELIPPTSSTSQNPPTSSTVATQDTSTSPAETTQTQPSSTSSGNEESTTSTSLCIITATPVPEYCLNVLPDGCQALETTNGKALESIIPGCEKAIGSYITEDMKECWAGEFTDQSRGEYIADCLLYELEDCCITSLPQVCSDLRSKSGSALVDGADQCRHALGPFVHGIASPCLDADNITPQTQGKSIADCLEVAYGFRSGPVTITDGEICPRTSSP